MGIYLRAITFRRLIIALSLALLFCSQLFAQVVTSDSLLFENKIFDESFKTIIFSKLNNNLSEPVLALNSNEKLKLQFDDLSEETKDLSFTFIHYDRDGKKSNLTESDYINGFNFDHILNYKNSFNTIQNFYHYEIIIPNENIQPIISGNYLLVVYDNSNPEKVYLTQRFWITENTATLSTKVQRANDIEIRNTHQEIDVKVNIGTTKINNPYEDSKLVIVQNNNFKNAITTLKPVFIVDKEWDYNYDLENTFEGGNEFRNFDVRSIKFLTQYIDHVQIDSLNKLTSVYLKREEKKNTQRYAVSDDINGRFFIKIYE
jgi:ribosomal 50S subunit-recycling heat shock protein